jgi:hypothetical protein
MQVTMVIYSIDRERVDPVFLACVPDSFMARDPEARPHRRPGDWADVIERPLVPAGDRWSF